MISRSVKYSSLLIIVFLIIGGIWFISSLIDIEKPEINVNRETPIIGRQKTIAVTFSDRRSGLSDTSVTISQGDRSYTLHSAQYPPQSTQDKTVSITIDPLGLKLQDGPALLSFNASDQSIFKNSNLLKQHVTIDTIPLQVFLHTPQNYINPGGTCVSLYRTSKPVASSGVWVDNIYFPAYPITLSEKPFYIVYFGLPAAASQGTTRIKITATDQAGNEAVAALPHLIRKVKFRADKINLSDNFLQQKMPEFQTADAQLRGKTNIETFIYINANMRQENFKTIQAITRKSEARQLWSGAFLRMKDASPMARYGDKRTWLYNSTPVGDSLHEGVDLASLERAPIEAANNGIVVFTGMLGIYGNTVIIDHGFGLFTLYAHLSGINVKPQQTVSKGEVIGNSGMTGLAGGDHLHFSVIVGGHFVNPIEWWDTNWIADNVTRKMAAAN